MNLACVVFQSGDYTQAAIEAETYRATFRAMGHGFDILISTKDSGVTFNKLQAGRDRYPGRYESSILVDGVVSHHPNRAKSAGRILNTAYDAVLFLGLCPYPTRDYGSEPHWLKLYEAIKRPKLGKVIDLMPGTDWPKLAMAALDTVWFSQLPFVPEGSDARLLPCPYLRPTAEKIEKNRKRSVVWSGGWNRVDGIVEFIHEIPKIGEHSRVTLTGIGSQYFRQRTKTHWIEAVNKDGFADFDGFGPADSIGRGAKTGVTPLMSQSWAAVDLIGLEGGDLHSNYSEGMYTPSMIEALYKGTWPVVSAQCEAHSPIPVEFVKGVLNQGDISSVIQYNFNEPLAGTQLGDRAREWVTDTHDSYANAATMIEDIGGMK